MGRKSSFSAYKYKIKNYLMKNYEWQSRHSKSWVDDNENYLRSMYAQNIDPYQAAMRINNEVNSG